MKKTKLIIIGLGITILLVNLIWVTRIFIIAYLSPNKVYAMNMNSINEALPELILMLLLLPCGLYIILKELKEFYEKVKA